MKLQYILLILLSVFTLSNQAYSKTHILKRGETLASVARTYYGEPVFGPKGSLNKIFKLNPSLKTNPNLVEPGLELTLEDKEEMKESAVSMQQSAHSMHSKEPDHTQAEKVEAASEPEGKKEMEDQTVQSEELVIKTVPQASRTEQILEIKKEMMKPTEIVTEAKPIRKEFSMESFKTIKRSQYMIAPTYSFVSLKTTHNPSGNSLDLASTSAYGFRLGWEYEVNENLATDFSGEYKQFKSDTVSGISGIVVADSTELYKIDFSFLYKLNSDLKFGFGLNYAQDVFIETDPTTFVPVPFLAIALSPTIKVKYTVMRWSTSEIESEAKLALVPADAGGDHDVRKGTNMGLGFSYQEKINTTTSWSVGVDYETNDQARVGMKQLREDTNIHFGYHF